MVKGHKTVKRGTELELQVREAIRKIFSEISTVSVKQIKGAGGEDGADVTAVLNSRDGAKKILIEVKNSGQPRIARNAIYQLREYSKNVPSSYCILAAPYISSEAALMCKEAEIGYLDLSGNCRIAFEGIYIERKGESNKFTEKRELRSIYSPRASRILRALLINPKRTWTLSELSAEAEVSIGLGWKVKKTLLEKEWIAIEQERIRLIAPEAMLFGWSSNFSFRKNEIRDYYSIMPIANLEENLASICAKRKIRYAFTSFSAARRLAPAVRQKRVFVYVDCRDGKVEADIGLRQADSGPNVTVIYPCDEGVFQGATIIEGASVVSPIQAYLDLSGFKGRGDEAAEVIYREIIKPTW